jgi:DNA-directed RNA polymerase subunit L
MTDVEATRQCLELQCSESQVESQKLARELAAECAKGRNLLVTTEVLQHQLDNEVNAKVELNGDLALQTAAVEVARKAVKKAKEEHNKFEKRAKAAENKVEAMRRTVKSLRASMATLQVHVGTATLVHF